MKIISLNIEGHAHLIERVLPFLQKERPDLVCLQEVFEVDLDLIAASLGMSYHFVSMALVDQVSIHQKDALGSWGAAVFVRDDSQLEKNGLSHKYYVHAAVRQDQELPIFFDGEDPNSMHRVVVSAEFKPNSIFSQILNNGEGCAVATTHFTWSPKGSFTDQQQQAYTAMKSVLAQFQPHVLCGDFNSPRLWIEEETEKNGKDYQKNVFGLLATEYRDTIPEAVLTSIDGQFHKAGDLELMVDGMFVQSQLNQPSKVRVVGGLSDHKAVVAEW